MSQQVSLWRHTSFKDFAGLSCDFSVKSIPVGSFCFRQIVCRFTSFSEAPFGLSPFHEVTQTLVFWDCSSPLRQVLSLTQGKKVSSCRIWSPYRCSLIDYKIRASTYGLTNDWNSMKHYKNFSSLRYSSSTRNVFITSLDERSLRRKNAFCRADFSNQSQLNYMCRSLASKEPNPFLTNRRE